MGKLIGFLILLAVLAGAAWVGWHVVESRRLALDGPVDFLAFDSFTRTGRPSEFLMAPEDATAAPVDAVSPIFPVTPEEIVQAFVAVINETPRATVLAISDDGLALEVAQRSATFGFIDFISIRAYPAGEDLASFAIYSRARVGYYDFGVNRDRVLEWVDRVRARITPET